MDCVQCGNQLGSSRENSGYVTCSDKCHKELIADLKNKGGK